jgi:hypothetical protein
MKDYTTIKRNELDQYYIKNMVMILYMKYEAIYILKKQAYPNAICIEYIQRHVCKNTKKNIKQPSNMCHCILEHIEKHNAIQKVKEDLFCFL